MRYLQCLIILFCIQNSFSLLAQELSDKRIAIIGLDAEIQESMYKTLDNKEMSGGEKLSFNIMKIGTNEKLREQIIPSLLSSLEETNLDLQPLDIFKGKLRYDNVGIPMVTSLKKRITKKNLIEEADVFIDIKYRFHALPYSKGTYKSIGEMDFIVYDETGNQIKKEEIQALGEDVFNDQTFILEGKEFDKTKMDHIDTMINYFLPLANNLHDQLNENLGFPKEIKSKKPIENESQENPTLSIIEKPFQIEGYLLDKKEIDNETKLTFSLKNGSNSPLKSDTIVISLETVPFYETYFVPGKGHKLSILPSEEVEKLKTIYTYQKNKIELSPLPWKLEKVNSILDNNIEITSEKIKLQGKIKLYTEFEEGATVWVNLKDGKNSSLGTNLAIINLEQNMMDKANFDVGDVYDFIFESNTRDEKNMIKAYKSDSKKEITIPWKLSDINQI